MQYHEYAEEEDIETASQFEESQGSELEMEDLEDPTSWLPNFERQVGPTVDIDEPIDAFSSFFDDEILEMIVRETNRYADECIGSKEPLPLHSRLKAWKPTDISEIKTFLALQIAMGLCKHSSIKDYWSNYWLTKTPNFGSVMSRNRFQMLTSFQHFANNQLAVERGSDGYDPLFKIRNVYDHISLKCLNCYIPGKMLSIDEMMVSWKGRLSFKQYAPKKPVKWGMKCWTLAESTTGYVLKCSVYTGKPEGQVAATKNLSKQVVLDALEGFEEFGHIVFMDSYFSSPRLFLTLQDKNIGACGTVNSNRQGMISVNHAVWVSPGGSLLTLILLTYLGTCNMCM